MLRELTDNKPVAFYTSPFRFTAGQLQEMCELQNHANNQMFSDSWTKESNKVLPYYRAALVEAVEAIDKMGYKWWKKKETLDATALEAIRIELIDILHFTLSDEIRKHGSIQNAVYNYVEKKPVVALHPIGSFHENPFDGDGFEISAREPTTAIVTDIGVFSFNDLCEQLIFTVLKEGCSNLHMLGLLFANLSMTPDDVYLRYIAKNTLNLFRNSNGQREGTYYRIWDGVDDDDVLAEFIQTRPHTSKSELYSYLELKYSTAVRKEKK